MKLYGIVFSVWVISSNNSVLFHSYYHRLQDFIVFHCWIVSSVSVLGFSIHPAVDEHQTCLLFFDYFVNSSGEHGSVEHLFDRLISSVLDVYPSSEMTSTVVHSNMLIIYTPTLSVCGSAFLCSLANIPYFVLLSLWLKWWLIMLLICVSLLLSGIVLSPTFSVIS